MKLPSALRTACSIALAILPYTPTTATAASTANLPSYPLAVRNPYLSTWVPGRNILRNAPTAQPQFWTGENITWPVLVRVNGSTYSLFGLPVADDSANGIKIKTATTVSVKYTSTHTLVNLAAGVALVTLDFFSPVSPGPRHTDYLRQSLPFSYLTVNATTDSTDPIDLQVLTAIDHTWTAQDGRAGLNFTTQGDTGLFWFFNPDQIPFTERNDRATYGSVVFATTTGAKNKDKVTAACDSAAHVFGDFARNGRLATTSSTSCSGTDLAALSKDVGPVSKGVFGSVTFAVGLDRENTINYLGVPQTSYHRSKWPRLPDAVQYFLQDHDAAVAASTRFDSQVREKSEAVSTIFGEKYADIVEASVRQAFGAMELTVPLDNLKSKPSVFLKEISSNGNIQTVDVIYQTWPIFVNLNPEYIRLLLQPIVSYLERPKSHGWPKPWVIHDLGLHYPNATGHNDGIAESLPVFESSSLFILLYAYQKFSGNDTWTRSHRPLLEGYAKYLAENTLYPARQLTSVDAIRPTANQTALAIQATIGLKAASKVTANRTYDALATSYARRIYHDGLGLDGNNASDSTHFTYNYGNGSTWNVLFTAFSDAMLDLNTFPAEAWGMQSDWYLGRIQEAGLAYAGPESDTNYTGKPLTWGITDWNIVAAAASSTAVQEAVVNTTHAFLTNGLNDVPFGTKYTVTGPNAGKWVGNKARGTVGSHFALLALQQRS